MVFEQRSSLKLKEERLSLGVTVVHEAQQRVVDPVSNAAGESGVQTQRLARRLGRDEPRGVLQVPEDKMLRVGRPRLIRLVFRCCVRWRDDPDRRHLQLVVLRVPALSSVPYMMRGSAFRAAHTLKRHAAWPCLQWRGGRH